MPPAPEGRRRPFGDDAASRGALQPRQIFKAHRDAAGSTREQDLEAGGGAGSAPGDQLRDLRFCKISLSRLLVGHKSLEDCTGKKVAEFLASLDVNTFKIPSLPKRSDAQTPRRRSDPCSCALLGAFRAPPRGHPWPDAICPVATFRPKGRSRACRAATDRQRGFERGTSLT